MPTALAGTLALTPSIAGALPQLAAPTVAVQRTVNTVAVARPSEQSRLLAVTRGALVPESSASTPDSQLQDARPLLEAILAKLDGLAERPIEVAVTTKLDGRQIARAVYKDIVTSAGRSCGGLSAITTNCSSRSTWSRERC